MTVPPSAIFGGTTAMISPLASPISSFQTFDTSESQIFLNKEDYLRQKHAEEKFSIENQERNVEGGEDGDGEDDGYENDESFDKRTQKITINRDLLIYKAFYFLFYGAVGSLFPYLVVFYKQLYLSAQQVGFLIGIRPFIQMCTVPLWGAIADTYNVKKCILLLAIGAWLATNYSLCIVRIPPETACNVTASMIQFPKIGKLVEPNRKTVKNFTVAKVSDVTLKNNLTQNTEHLDKGLIQKPDSNTEHGVHSNTQRRSINNVKEEQYQSNDHDHLSTPLIKERVESWNGQLKEDTALLEESQDEIVLLTMTRIQKRKRRNMNKNTTTINKISKDNSTKRNAINDFLTLIYSRSISEIDKLSPNVQTGRSRQPRSINELNKKYNKLWSKSINKTVVDYQAPVQRLLAADEIEEEFDSLNTDDQYPWPIGNIEESKEEPLSNEQNSKNALDTFVVLIIITVLGTVLASPAATLADTATLERLGGESYQYGYQRLWGAFGWGLCAFVVGAIVSSIQLQECKEGKHVDYILSFYVYAAMMSLAFLCAVFFKFNPVETDSDYTESLWETVKVFSDCQHIVFVLTLLITGASMGFVHTFLFWHLHDLGGTQFLFSVISAIQCISEVLMYLLSSYLLQKIGCDNVMYIGLTANIIRLFAYSFLTQPIYSIILEILQGISSASIWTAAICYIGLIPGTPVTLQAFLHAIYWGLGHGGGGILGGVLVTYFGSKTTFITYGILCTINLVILAGIKYWSKLLYVLCNYTHVENIQAGTYILTSMSQRQQRDDETLSQVTRKE